MEYSFYLNNAFAIFNLQIIETERIMKAPEYFENKIAALRNELYSEINELASNYQKDNKRRMVYPNGPVEIAFCNESSEKFEPHKIKDILIDEKGVCIYPESSDYLPYELTDIINVHDLMVLKSIIVQELNK